MTLSRRSFIRQTAGVGLALGAIPRLAHSAISLGQFRLDVVSDGSLTLPGSFIFAPMPQDELAGVLAPFDQPLDELTPPCNCTLLRTGERVVLFDVGSGVDFSPNSGILVDSLDSLGVSPEEITDVVFTHAHPDHLWGLLDDFGDLLFPEASFWMGQKEWDYWFNPNTVDEIGEAMASFAVGARRRMELIEDQVSLFGDAQEIIPGVLARSSFGHTPGHMSFEVGSGADTAMILGDSIGNHHVAFERPEWPSGSDQDRELAVETRVALLDQLSSSRMPVIGYHLPGGIGRVETKDSHYRFVREV